MSVFDPETFVELELKHELFDLAVAGIRPWERVRFEVSRDVKRMASGEGVAHDRPDGVGAYLKAGSLFASNLVRKNPFFSDSAEYLFFGHPRRKLEEDGHWWDIYCDPIHENTDLDALHLEYSNFLEHKRLARTDRLRYYDCIDLIGVFTKELGIPSVNIPSDVTDRLTAMEVDIDAHFDVEIDLIGRVGGVLRERRVTRPLYKRLIKQIDPSVIVVVVSYGRQMATVIEVAKTLDIPVVELQHGVIYSGHLGYSYPEGVPVETYPDYLFTFGEFWNDQANFPIDSERVIAVGYPYLEHRQEALSEVESANQVVFISQGTVGKQLSQAAVELAKSDAFDWQIVYKLHPGEYDRWREAYPWLQDAPLRVIDSDSPSLYRLFAESRAQVGVGSTALFEGLAFGLNTYVFDLPGAEVLNPLLRYENVELVSDPESIIEYVQNTSIKESEELNIFLDSSINNIRNELFGITPNGMKVVE